MRRLPSRKAISDPEVAEYFKRVKSLAQFEPIVCDVAHFHYV